MPVSEHKRRKKCECGKMGVQVLDAPRLAFAQRECRYDSPIDGTPVTSWAQRRDDMARNGCREYDPEMKTDAARFRNQMAAELDAAVDDTVDRAFDAMPTHKREQLTNELTAGADLQITRS